MKYNLMRSFFIVFPFDKSHIHGHSWEIFEMMQLLEWLAILTNWCLRGMITLTTLLDIPLVETEGVVPNL